MRWTVAVAVVVLGGCASGGGAGEETGVNPSDIPIYMTQQDVPCAYETVETVRGYVSYRNFNDYERARDAYLRRAAARAGADAVLIPEDRREPGRGNVGVTVRRSGGIDQPSEAQVEGIAIRLTC